MSKGLGTSLAAVVAPMESFMEDVTCSAAGEARRAAMRLQAACRCISTTASPSSKAPSLRLKKSINVAASSSTVTGAANSTLVPEETEFAMAVIRRACTKLAVQGTERAGGDTLRLTGILNEYFGRLKTEETLPCPRLRLQLSILSPQNLR